MTTTQIDSDRSLLHIMGLCAAREVRRGWRKGGSCRQSKGKARMKGVDVTACAQHFVKLLSSRKSCYTWALMLTRIPVV